MSVTSKDAAENESTATVVSVTDQTPPSVPIVNEVSDQDTTVTGVTEANAVVTVKAGDATFSAVADGNGTFTVSIPVQIGGTTIAVSAKDKAGNESQAPSFAVKSTLKAPLAPKVNEVSDQDTMIKGTAEANATVIVKTEVFSLQQATQMPKEITASRLRNKSRKHAVRDGSKCRWNKFSRCGDRTG